MKEDRRVRRTKQNLFNALTELMKEKKYHKITIQDIIDRADVGRSTFYAHYETKDDLLFSQSVEYMEYLNEYVRRIMDMSSKNGALVSVEELFEHILENKKIIRSFFIAEGMDMFRMRAVNYWRDTISSFLVSNWNKENPNQVPPEILSSHIAMSLVNMLEFCIDSKVDYSAKDFDRIFQLMIRPLVEEYI